MDTFGWAGGQHDDVYFPRSVGQVGCGGRGGFELGLDDALLGSCFGFGQLQCDGGVGAGGAGACQVSSNFGAVGGAAGLVEDSMGFMSSGDVFAAVAEGGSGAQYDGLLEAALAFSRELGACGEGDGGAVPNGAMFSSYSGTTGGNISSGESNSYSGGGGGSGHDAEVVSPTSIMSPAAPSLSQAPTLRHPKRKLADVYPAIGAAPPAPPFPLPGAKRKATTAATSITFGQPCHDPTAGAEAGGYEPDMEAMVQVKEMIYRAAAMRPVHLGTEAMADKPPRKNVRISSDPQTVAARLRRERVSERLRVLQKLVPGGSKMDTASMLDEAASYLRFLKSQVQMLETLGTTSTSTATLQQQQRYYSNSPGFLGFARNNNSISGYANSNIVGNSSKLL